MGTGWNTAQREASDKSESIQDIPGRSGAHVGNGQNSVMDRNGGEEIGTK